MSAPTRSRQTRFGRVYNVPGYGDLPSVTTVIKQMAAPALENWKQQQVANAAIAGHEWRDKDPETAAEMILADARGFARKAALKGTEVHELIETGEVDVPPELGGFIAAAAEVISTLGEHYASEATLVNTTDGYAGTADVLCWNGSGLSVIDWKTVGLGKKVGWSNHALQLGALAACEKILTDDGKLVDMPDIDELVVVGLREDGSSHVQRTSDVDRIGIIQDAFMGLLAVHRFATTYPYLSVWED